MGPARLRLLAAATACLLAALPARAAEPARRTVVVSVGATITLRMSSGKPIALAENDKELVARVAPSPNDRTAVLVTGVAPGVAHITLTDDDGRKQVFRFNRP